MAAVAVLEMNMENNPVISRKPNNTFSLFFPKGFIMVLAIHTSNPDLVAAMARMKPPRKRIMVGSAKHAIIPTESRKSPYSPPSPCINLNDESLTKKSKTKIIHTDVAQAGMASVNQSMTAMTKMAITRCCTIVSPSMPKKLAGRFHTIIVRRAVKRNHNPFFLLKSPVKTLFTVSCIV